MILFYYFFIIFYLQLPQCKARKKCSYGTYTHRRIFQTFHYNQRFLCRHLIQRSDGLKANICKSPYCQRKMRILDLQGIPRIEPQWRMCQIVVFACLSERGIKQRNGEMLKLPRELVEIILIILTCNTKGNKSNPIVIE